MTVEIRIVPWQTLRIGVSTCRGLVEQLSTDDEREQFAAAVRRPPAIAEGLAYCGPAATLSAELERLLECRLVGDALTITLVPFSICGFDDPCEAFEVDYHASATGQIHRHVEGVDPHLIVDCELVEARWAELNEDVNFGLRVDEALSATERSEKDRGLVLLHDIAERLVPAARRLGLPLVIALLDRTRLQEAPATDATFERRLGASFADGGAKDEAHAPDVTFERRLDAFFADWGAKDEAPAPESTFERRLDASFADGGAKDEAHAPDATFERRLDASIADGAKDGAPSALENEAVGNLGVVVLHPFRASCVEILERALRATACEYELDPATLDVAFTAFPSALLVHLRAPGFRSSYDLHAELDMRHEPALGGSFGASLSGHLIDAVSDPSGSDPGAWTVMLAQGEKTVSVHEGFMYTYEGTDHGMGRGPLERLATRLALPTSDLEDGLRTPSTPYMPLDDVGLPATQLRQLRARL